MNNKIFGYDWEDIQAMQQKTYVRPTISGPIVNRAPDDIDMALLAEHGMEGLLRLGYHGTLDRLSRSTDKSE